MIENLLELVWTLTILVKFGLQLLKLRELHGLVALGKVWVD